MANRNQQQGRDGSNRGGRRNAASGPERHAVCERNAGRLRHSLAEKVASCWPLAILPSLLVTYCLLHCFVMPDRMPRRLAVLAGLGTAYLLNSLFTVWFYREDKHLAEQQLWRIRELNLHFWELFCGWPGALYAQKKYHHKWKKMSYMIVFWLCVILNLAMAICLVFPDAAKSVTEEGIRLIRGFAGSGS